MLTLRQLFQLSEDVVHLHAEEYRVFVSQSLREADGSQEVDRRLQKLCNSLGEILQNRGEHGIVYVVLNHTRFAGGRHFHAWLNEASVKPIVDTCDTVPEIAGDASAQVFLTGEANPAIRRLWLETWEQYSNSTDTLAASGLTTWNQLLLLYSQFPRSIGLTWDPHAEVRRTPYVKVTPQMLDEYFGLRVEPIGTPAPHPDVFLQSHCPDRCPLRKLEFIIRALDPIPPLSDATPHSVALCLVYHLLQSYAIWGGSSFISIPVLFRSLQPEGVSVLSLCTTRVLAPEQVAGWKAVAAAALQPLNTDLLDRQARSKLTIFDLAPDECAQILRFRLGPDRRTFLEYAGRDNQSHPLEELLTVPHKLAHLEKQLVHVKAIRGGIPFLHLVAKELELPEASSLEQVADAASQSTATPRILRFLQGRPIDLETRLRQIASDLFGPNGRGWQSLCGGLFLPDTGLSGADARVLRVWCDPKKLEMYVGEVAKSISTQIRSGQAALSVGLRCVLDTEDNYWIIVANALGGEYDHAWMERLGPGNQRTDLWKLLDLVHARYLVFAGPATEGGSQPTMKARMLYPELAHYPGPTSTFQCVDHDQVFVTALALRGLRL